MKLTKLNNRGFSHEILAVFFVVIFAIVGVGYLVMSHATTTAYTNTNQWGSFRYVLGTGTTTPLTHANTSNLTLQFNKGVSGYHPSDVAMYQLTLPASTTASSLTMNVSYSNGGYDTAFVATGTPSNRVWKVDTKANVTGQNVTLPLSGSPTVIYFGISATGSQGGVSGTFPQNRNLIVNSYTLTGLTTIATPAPTVSLTANPTSVTAGASSTLTWSSTNATSCTASGGWSGTKATSGSASTGAINTSTSYNLSCTGDGGTASATPVTVTVGTADPCSLIGLTCSIVKQDDASQSNPLPLWDSIDCADPTRVSYIAATSNTPAYRHITVLDGDNIYGERCEIGHNDWRYGDSGASNGTFHLYHEGDHTITFMDYRLGPNFPINTTTWQVVAQMKQTQPSDNGNGTPVLALVADHGMWGLRQSNSAGSSDNTTLLWSVPAHVNVWTRIAFDVTYSQDPTKGQITVYVDANGNGNFNDPGEKSPVFHTYTSKYEISPGDKGISVGQTIPSHLRVGIYHDPTISCPAANVCNLDVSKVQIMHPN